MRLLPIALLCGCGIDPFETPSAYDQQRYLCDDLDLLEEAALACQEEPEPCNGYISFQGQIQRVQLRVDTTLERGIVRLGENDAKEDVLSRIEISGAAPYFHFDTAISSIGTVWLEGTEPDDTLTFEAPDADNPPDFEDEAGAVQWYIRAGSDTAMLSSQPDEGTITVSYLSADRVDVQFAGGIGPVDDTLDACAIVFPQGGVE